MSFPFPGRSASISIGGTAKPLDTFELSIDGDPIDYTNFTSAGWREIVLGIRSVDITASGPYNGIVSGAAAGDPVGGAAVAFILAFGGTGPSLTITAQLTKVPLKTDVKGVAQVQYTALSTGAPTLSY